MTQPRPDLRHEPRRHDANGRVGVTVLERRPLEQGYDREHSRAKGGDLDQVGHPASLQHSGGIR